MRNAVFHYNKDTCQYEPASRSIRSIIIYGLGLLISAALLFIGIVTIYDRFTETQAEANLRNENAILDKHQILLNSQLADVETTLASLKALDQGIYQKLFEENTSVAVSSSADKKNILLGDASHFKTSLNKVNVLSGNLLNQAATSNQQFNTLNISKKDIKILNSIPTLQPIANPNLHLLVSGYGIRINPFHKGKYKHPGIDFAAHRGTKVFASASGKIVRINKSVLQAGYGNAIEIDHGQGFITRYAHLEQINISQGQRVTKGMVIGTVGDSGGAIAPHLHYEVIHQGETVDPVMYMIEGLNSNDYNTLISLSKKQNQSLD